MLPRDELTTTCSVYIALDTLAPNIVPWKDDSFPVPHLKEIITFTSASEMIPAWVAYKFDSHVFPVLRICTELLAKKTLTLALAQTHPHACQA